MNLLEKIKSYIKFKKELFKNMPFKQKLIFVLNILIILSLISYTLFVSLNFIRYQKEVHAYEKSPYKNIQEQISDGKHLRSFQDSVNLIKKDKIETVEFIVSDINNYSEVKIVLKDNFIIQYSTILSFSIANNIEPFLIKENIPYIWTNQNKYPDKISRPSLEKEESHSDLSSEIFFKILMYGLLFYYLRKFMPGLGSKKFEVIYPDNIKNSLNDLVGMDKEIKKEILQLKDMILNQKVYSEYGITNLFNIAFSGPAGTGKSKLALSLAKELNLPMIIGTGNVETGFVGGGASTIRDLFQAAENIAYLSEHKTAIIFLDESQNLFMKRGGSREKWADDAANELLAQLDGISSLRELNIIFIAASNFDDSNMLIDEAMDRRFQKKIYFKLPSQPERKEILEFYINKIDETLKGSINLDYIASITSGLSPAKLESIVKETSFMAIREKLIIDTDLLFKGFERITIGLTDRDESKLDRSRIIFHELGHFICEFDRHHSSGNSISEIKEHMKFLKISSESISKLGALGYVLNSEKDNKLSTRLDIEEEIIALYGGYAAENVYFSNGDGSLVSTGAYNDIEKVSKLLKTVVIDMGMYSKSKVNFGIIGLKNDESFIKEIESISEGLFDKAMERVKTHKALIDYLEPIIFERWVLSKDEIFEIIESFYKK